MNDSVKALFDAAAQVRLQAHAPYSGFRVGAALRAEDGRIYVGCNVENAAYPSGTCAEQAAIAAMVAGGARKIQLMAVLADSPQPVTPCGACRQRIREFVMSSTQVHAGNLAGARQHFAFTDLLPESFGPDALPERS